MALKTCETFHTLVVGNNAVNSQHIVAEYRFLGANEKKSGKESEKSKNACRSLKTENDHMAHIINTESHDEV